MSTDEATVFPASFNPKRFAAAYVEALHAELPPAEVDTILSTAETAHDLLDFMRKLPSNGNYNPIETLQEAYRSSHGFNEITRRDFMRFVGLSVGTGMAVPRVLDVFCNPNAPKDLEACFLAASGTALVGANLYEMAKENTRYAEIQAYFSDVCRIIPEAVSKDSLNEQDQQVLYDVHNAIFEELQTIAKQVTQHAFTGRISRSATGGYSFP